MAVAGLLSSKSSECCLFLFCIFLGSHIMPRGHGFVRRVALSIFSKDKAANVRVSLLGPFLATARGHERTSDPPPNSYAVLSLVVAVLFSQYGKIGMESLATRPRQTSHLSVRSFSARYRLLERVTQAQRERGYVPSPRSVSLR